LALALLSLVRCGADGAGGGGTTAPARVLTGSVVSQGTGGPIADARVVILDGRDAGRSGQTGVDGRYRIEGLTGGAFSAQASASSFDSLTESMTPGEGPAELEFRLARGACQEARCDQPSACNESLPLFLPPFDGTALATNLFDHQYPRSFSDDDPAFVSYCGEGNRSGAQNGHAGHDWALPEGTPLLAVADGTITFAGQEAPFYCPLLNREVAGLWLRLEIRSPHGELFWAHYVHLRQPLVVTGQVVRAGDVIALSGNTGCSTGPHLHLQVYRESSNRQIGGNGGAGGLVDPYGWQGPGRDPWSSQPGGAFSALLWIQPPHTRARPDRGVGTTAAPRAADILDMNTIQAPEVPRR
jgi:murein DD-endopeptidase MepM/ murein hydrolase activator NlpD